MSCSSECGWLESSMEPLFVTLGDFNGLGPELLCRYAALPGEESAPLVLVGAEKALEYHRNALGVPRFWRNLDAEAEQGPLPPGIYLLQPDGVQDLRFTPGQPGTDGGLAAGRSLDAACKLLRRGRGRGLVTCPLDKRMLQEAGYNFPGHTQYLARGFGLEEEEVCMHLAASRLRVSLATTHLPLQQVPQSITREKILHYLRLTRSHLQRLAVTGPIAVCGLNPHAGEHGVLGVEEEETLEPAVEEAAREGLLAVGPLPADTLFARALRGEFSAVLAMYHDQGLAPLKTVFFGRAVNVTLGLPVIRTSVDHGTGYELVGESKAKIKSLREAISLASSLARAGPLPQA